MAAHLISQLMEFLVPIELFGVAKAQESFANA